MRAKGEDAAILDRWPGKCALLQRTPTPSDRGLKAVALEPARIAVAARYPDRAFAVTRSLELVADRRKAQFSTWYEMFPRSAAYAGPPRHVARRRGSITICRRNGVRRSIPAPVHPIGVVNRKGKNNALAALPDDVEVPGLLARPKAATRTSTASLDRWRIFGP